MRKSDRRSDKKIINDELARMVKHGGISAIKTARRSNLTGQKSDQRLALSDYELALITESAEVPGRLSDERAARLLAGVVIRTAPAQWSIHHVRVRLKEAARGCERIVGRVGPRNDRGFWPDPALYANASAEERNIWFFAERDGTRAPPPIQRGAGSAFEISRIFEAIAWPSRYLSEPSHDKIRMALHCWGWCEAREEPFDEYFRTLGCSRRMAYYRIEAALGKILDGVITDDIEP